MFFLRPTATELLKHPIFKKAKDKKYLQSTLIAIGPSLETRVQKVTFFNYVKYDVLKTYVFITVACTAIFNEGGGYFTKN